MPTATSIDLSSIMVLVVDSLFNVSGLLEYTSLPLRNKYHLGRKLAYIIRVYL